MNLLARAFCATSASAPADAFGERPPVRRPRRLAKVNQTKDTQDWVADLRTKWIRAMLQLWRDPEAVKEAILSSGVATNMVVIE